MKKKVFSICLIIIFAINLFGCAAFAEQSAETSENEEAESPAPLSVTAENGEIFSQRDFDAGYSEDDSVHISLEGESVSCDSALVEFSEGVLRIKGEGTFILQGRLEGMMTVDADKSDKLQLVLDGVSIESADSAAIYVLQADKLFITLAEGSENSLSNGGEFTAIDENNIDGVIFSKDDVTINGGGSLDIVSPAGHGIVVKDSLCITGGEISINSASNGIEAKDNVCIAEGSFNIVSGKDAIKAENEDEEELGFVYISGGSFNLSSEGDGISASGDMQIDGAYFDILAGGGSENAVQRSSDMWGQFMPGGRGAGRGMSGGKNGDSNPPRMPEGMEAPADGMNPPQMPDGMEAPMNAMNPPQMPEGMTMPVGGGQGFEAAPPEESQTQQSGTEGSSMKGFKAAKELTVNSGSFKIDSADDAFHSDLVMSINGGEFEISSGDDAFHAEETLTVKGGSIEISRCYEGLEALELSIFDGDISLVADDDGLNAAGGVDMSGFGGRDSMFGEPGAAGSGGIIRIAGGTISIVACGDGLDSNGSIEMSGGFVTVSGPAHGDTSIIDYQSSAVISGGTFLGAGGSMMAQSFSESGQGFISLSVGQQSAGTGIELKNSAGESLISFCPELDYCMVIISSPRLIKGESYTLTIADSSGEFTA